MSIAISDNFERDQLVASFTGQMVFTYSFPIFSDTYLTVYQYGATEVPDDPTQKLTLGVDYTVQGVGEAAGGTITLVVGATIGDIITIVGTQPIDRQSVFQDLNPFTVALNQQLNQMTVMLQQVFTYWANITPHYNYDELVSTEVRPFKLILPMLGPGETWVGRGTLGTIPDDITTAMVGGGGTGNVVAQHSGLRPSIALWTGTDFIITDSNLNIVNNLITPTVGDPANSVTGFDDTWGAYHWPNQPTTGRPTSPSNGDTYYDSTLGQFFGFIEGVWLPFGIGNGNQQIITQTAHGLIPGNWVRINSSGLYVTEIATTPQNAENIGLVISVTTNQFVLQDVGYVTAGVFMGLTPGGVYFLSDTMSGMMTLTEPSINGEVSLPLFVAETATTGWIRQSRGFVIGGQPAPNGGGGNNPNIIDVYQPGHNFTVGQYLKVAGIDTYGLALADDGVDVWGVGFCINVIDANNFVLQTEGYCANFVAPFPALDATTVYWLSDTIPGGIQDTAPVATDSWTKPVLIALSDTEGFILNQRPLPVSGTPPDPVPEDEIYHSCFSPDSIALTAGSWVTVPCLAVTITPSAATSKIRVQLVLVGDRSGSTAPPFYSRLTRNGTPVQVGNATGGRIAASNRAFQEQTFESMLVIDTPNSTSALTYNVQIYTASAGQTLLLQTDFINTYVGSSTMIADEILI